MSCQSCGLVWLDRNSSFHLQILEPLAGHYELARIPMENAYSALSKTYHDLERFYQRLIMPDSTTRYYDLDDTIEATKYLARVLVKATIPQTRQQLDAKAKRHIGQANKSTKRTQ